MATRRVTVLRACFLADFGGTRAYYCHTGSGSGVSEEGLYEPFVSPGVGGSRVLRGGSCRDSVTGRDYFRCAFRSGDAPALRYDNYGFRCARTP